MASSAPIVPRSGNSMFDCPDESHTAPTRTSFTTISLEPLTTMLKGPVFVWLRLSRTRHRPLASAAVSALASPTRTVTDSPGPDHPHTGTSALRIRTMWSEKIEASLTWDHPAAVHQTARLSA